MLRRSARTIPSMPGYCTLTAHRRPSCNGARCTCASEADAIGTASNSAKTAFERAAELALDRLADHRERPRRHAIVQARERRDPFVGEHVGARRDELRGLDEQPLEADRGAIERVRRAEILPAIKLGLVAIVDEARP